MMKAGRRIGVKASGFYVKGIAYAFYLIYIKLLPMNILIGIPPNYVLTESYNLSLHGINYH